MKSLLISEKPIEERIGYKGTAIKVLQGDLISYLNHKIDKVLSELIPADSRLAILDFPNHHNVGDSIIWLGEKVYLKRRGVSIVYQCDIATYSKEVLAHRLGDGIILLNGGGNFGDLWYRFQQFRERVVKDFPKNRIIQLPQSLYFRDPEKLALARSIINGHQDFTILARDMASLEIAQNEFRSKSLLCPDMAFAVGKIRHCYQSTEKVLWLTRDISDLESLPIRMPPSDLHCEQRDWIEEEENLITRADHFFTTQARLHPRRLNWLFDWASVTFDYLARARLRRGCKILSQASIVITNRLHAHILCLILGIPHIVFDTGYGKVRNFYLTWTKDSNLCHWANSSEEALELAKSLKESALYQ